MRALAEGSPFGLGNLAERVGELLPHLREIEFMAPERAWLALPAILVLAAAPLLRRRQRRRAPVTLSLLLRATALAALLVVLCEPTFVEHGERVGRVIAVADISPSVGEMGVARAREFLAGAGADVKTVAFAAQPRAVDDPKTLEPASEPATDIRAALRFAAAHAGARRPVRLVVLTDGRDTGGGFSGSGAAATATRLRAHGFEIAAVGVPATTPPAPPPVALRELRAEAVDEPGQVPTLRAVAVADADTEVQAILYIDGSPTEPRTWKLQEGENELLLAPPPLSPGRYHVQLLLTGDKTPDDNIAETTIIVRGAPRVLVLAAEERKALIAQALTAQGMEVRVAGAAGVESFDDYEAIVILPDADAEALDKHAADLTAFVGQRGGGLLAIGGGDGPGLARFAGSPLSFLLPVEVDARRAPQEEPAPPEENSDPQPKIEIKEEETEAYPITLCVLMDRSGSMAGPKIQQAKIAAASAARALTPQDRIAVIAFGDSADVVLAPQAAGDQRRVAALLARMPATGRTVMFAALRRAYQLMAEEKSPIRHIVMISDGVPTDSGRWRDLVLAGTRSKITLSCVGIGFQVDRRHLGTLSKWGKGQMWTVVNAHEIPQVVTQDTLRVVRTRNERGKDAERSAPKPETEKKPEQKPEEQPKPKSDDPPKPPERKPGVAFKADASAPREMLKGVSDADLPEVSGVEESKPRFAAWVAARADDGEEGQPGTPLLAYRRIGLGTTAAFMVDPEAPGGAALREHAEFSRLMGQLLRSILPDGSPAKVQLRTQLSERGQRLVLSVYGEDGARRTDLPVTLAVGGDALPIVRRADGYEAGLPNREEPVTARVRVGAASAPLLERVFVLPGSRDPERGVTGIDREALLQLAGDPDLIDLSAQEALAPPVAPTASTEPVGLPFLLLAAILLPLEAWARRRARSASRLRRATPSA